MSNPFVFSVLPAPLRGLLMGLTGCSVLARWYEQWQQSAAKGVEAFLSHTCTKLRVNHALQGSTAEIPRSGPLLIVANHPLGGLEGVILTRILLRHRPDLKVLTNELLLRIPEFQDVFIGVDVLSTGQASRNARGLRRVNQHLAQGGALLVFPAGVVAHMTLRDWTVRDSSWHSLIGRLALKHRAQCLPIHVGGKNPRWFYLSGLIHPRLRTALLPRALLAQQRRVLPLRIGPSFLLPETMNPIASTALQRLSCEVLVDNPQHDVAALVPETPVAHALDTQACQQLIEELQAYCVHQRKSYAVYCAPFEALGGFGLHLAREREHTFRLVGEGTGQALDSDRYDRSHHHVLVWDHAAQRLVGGYRVADAQAIIATHGIEGLYTRSLFAINENFLNSFQGTIEVGRSFVTPAYQNDLHALDLLWCGLGAFVRQHPHCHTFFGCVSIAQTYPPLLRNLIIAVLLKHYAATDDPSSHPSALHALAHISCDWMNPLVEDLSDISSLNTALATIDKRWRVPVLIRHYLALGGRFFNFALNPGFNAASDGLVMVDLRQTPPRYMRRYLGDEQAKAFEERHPSSKKIL